MVVALHAGIEPNNLAEIFPLSTIYQLPSKLVKIEEKWSLAAESKYTFEIPSCPEIKPQNNHAEIIRSTLQDIFSGYYNCLFLRNFQNNRKEMCDIEPRSTLVSRIHNDGSPVICGVKDYQQLVDVQYYVSVHHQAKSRGQVLKNLIMIQLRFVELWHRKLFKTICSSS